MAVMYRGNVVDIVHTEEVNGKVMVHLCPFRNKTKLPVEWPEGFRRVKKLDRDKLPKFYNSRHERCRVIVEEKEVIKIEQSSGYQSELCETILQIQKFKT